MASTSGKKPERGSEKKAARQGSQDERAALPFEPKRSQSASERRSRRREKDADGSATNSATDKKAERKAQKQAKKKAAQAKNGAETAVSAKAQARVEAIRAANKKREAAKAAEAIAGPDSDGSIPKDVSRRMIRRMAILSITPIALGVSIFFLSYYLLSNQIVTFAPIVTLLTTMGCFGLGVVGLTYGMLSASWDEEPGSLIGFDEFKLNFGRIMDARKASKT